MGHVYYYLGVTITITRIIVNNFVSHFFKMVFIHYVEIACSRQHPIFYPFLEGIATLPYHFDSFIVHSIQYL